MSINMLVIASIQNGTAHPMPRHQSCIEKAHKVGVQRPKTVPYVAVCNPVASTAYRLDGHWVLNYTALTSMGRSIDMVSIE